MRERLNPIDMALIGSVCLISAGGGVEINSVISEEFNPTPKLESTRTDEVIFQAKTPASIAKGVKAALEYCRIKNIAFEKQTDGKSKTSIKCEPGTLKIKTVMTPTTAQ